MTLHELLQTELWSKKTTRKILIVLAAVVCVCLAWMAVEQHWLTPGERRAGRQALAQIDSLQEFGNLGNEVFEARVKETREQIDAANRAALTNRDRGVARTLGFYLDLTKIDQEETQKLQSLRQTAHSTLSFRDEEFAIDAAASAKRARLLLRTELHAALD